MPGAVAQAIKDADTFFGIELPALTEWAFGPEQAAAIDQPVLSVLGTETQPLWVEVAALLRSSLPHVEDCRSMASAISCTSSVPSRSRRWPSSCARHPMARG